MIFNFQCLEDKDALINLIAGSRDYHMQKIDSREDKLIKRARAWASDLISAMQVYGKDFEFNHVPISI